MYLTARKTNTTTTTTMKAHNRIREYIFLYRHCCFWWLCWCYLATGLIVMIVIIIVVAVVIAWLCCFFFSCTFAKLTNETNHLCVWYTHLNTHKQTRALVHTDTNTNAYIQWRDEKKSTTKSKHTINGALLTVRSTRAQYSVVVCRS